MKPLELNRSLDLERKTSKTSPLASALELAVVGSNFSKHSIHAGVEEANYVEDGLPLNPHNFFKTADLNSARPYFEESLRLALEGVPIKEKKLIEEISAGGDLISFF